MNLRQMEMFRAVMIAGSINGAARLLFVSQPAVSRMLAHTEQVLGYPLFQRIKGRIHPTREALLLYRELETAYGVLNRVRTLAHELAECQQNSLAVVSSPSLGHSLMPQCIATFRARHPGIRVRFTTLNADALVRSLLDGQSDLGVSFTPTAHSSLDSECLGSIPVVCILPPGHRLARRASLCARDIAGGDLIRYRAGTPFARMVDSFLGDMNRLRDIGIEVDSQQHVCDLVKEGAGIGLVDRLTLDAHRDAPFVARPVTPQYSVSCYLVASKYEPLSLPGQAFGSLLAARLNQLNPRQADAPLKAPPVPRRRAARQPESGRHQNNP